MSEDPGGPVVMLNLLRFAEQGRASYASYTEGVLPLLARYGGEVIYAGDGSTALVADKGQAWDAVVLVRYPSRARFLEMVADPELKRVATLRTAALSEAVLQATTPKG